MGRGGRYAVVVALCLAAAAGIVALVVVDSYEVQVNLGSTAGGLLILGPLVFIGISRAGTFAWVGWLAALAAVAAFGLLMGTLWSIDESEDGNETLAKLTGGFFVFSFALTHAAGVLSRVRADDNRLVTGVIAFAVLAVLAIAALFTIALVGEMGDETYFRVVAVIAVLCALGTALIPLLRSLRSGSGVGRE